MREFDGWFVAEQGYIYMYELMKELQQLGPEIGAFTTFTGVVREISDSAQRKVVGMEVEYWEEKGNAAMRAIAEKVGGDYSLQGMRIVHVYGKLPVGAPIVFVVIASIHRKEAFAALEAAINLYKTESPVWKKEIYKDASSAWIFTANEKHPSTQD